MKSKKGIRFYCRDCAIYGTAAIRLFGFDPADTVPTSCLDCGGLIIVEGQEQSVRDWPPMLLDPRPGIMNHYSRQN